MAPYKITIEYDGGDFLGFQRQMRARTVQDEIEKALRKLGWNEKSILFAGRTDTGVHAEGQVIAFRLDWRHKTPQLLKAINDYLPTDISAKEIDEADKGFHPRFDAMVRHYRYQIYVSELRRPLLERHYWRVWPEPGEEIILKASDGFIGEHDYRLLGCRSHEDHEAIHRTVDSISWQFEDDGTIFFHIEAQSFLYHMVRRIVFILIKAGQKRITLSQILKGDSGFSELPAGIAPANGLFLEKVIY